MPFHTDEEPTRNQGSTASSLEAAPSPTGPTMRSPSISTSGTSIGPDWLPRRPSASQEDGFAFASFAVDDEDREVVVAGEVGARRLHDVEVGEAARRRPRRLLAHLVPAVGALGAGGDGVPEVRAGLGVRVGQGPDLAAVERADVAVDERVGGAQHDRLHGAHVHDVAHGRRRAAVARDRLAGHGERHVVLAEAAVLLGHGQAEEAVFTEQFEVAPRVGQRVVGDLRVLAHLLLAQLDQEIAQLELALRQKPVGVPIRPQPEVGLIAPALLAHADLQGLARGRTVDK